jgi:hypothetical protein
VNGRKDLAAAVGEMRVAEIGWPLFRQALMRLDPAQRQVWLARWLFDDAGVRLKLCPASWPMSNSDPSARR